MTYPWASEPRRHQLESWQLTCDEVAYGYHWDPGTGKTKLLLDVACKNYFDARINAMLVVAPSVVHSNWVHDQIPRHAPEQADILAFDWFSDKAGTRRQQAQDEKLLGHDGLAVLAMTYDGICTDAGRDVARTFLKKRKVMMILDEAHRIKTPGAKRTKLLRNAGKMAVMRRTATGTPVTQSPFDVYAPICFLDADFWKRELNIGSFTAFKQYFAIWEDGWVGGKKFPRIKEIAGQKQYIRMDVLQATLAKIAHRLTKEDSGLDLPPKVYVRREFELSPKQRKAYDTLVAELETELAPGKYLEAPLALVRLTRLHQIACGYAVAMGDDRDELTWIPGDRPRLDLLIDTLSDLFSPVLVWASHREDCRVITEEINKRDLGRAVRIDGTVKDDDRSKALEAFHGSRARVMVANPATLGEGVTLNEAKAAIYYSHDWRLGPRVQSEDRNNRIGQTVLTTIYDFIAKDTIDERIVDALVGKADIAAQVSGDQLREWIRRK